MTTAEGLELGFQLIGGLYITVRGLSNIEEGLKQRVVQASRRTPAYSKAGDLAFGQVYLWWKRLF